MLSSNAPPGGPRLLLHYLRRHAKSAVPIALFIMIFALVFSLYDLPLEAVGYAALLCAVLLLLLGTYGFLRFRARHRMLAELEGRVTLGLHGLPAPADLIERDYQILLARLAEHNAALVSQADSRYSSMMDYYTLWAHQIKTPIAAMRLLLQAGEHNPELQTELFRIEQYADMVLSYLRLESDTTDLVLREQPLDAILRGAVRKYAPLFIRGRIALRYEPAALDVLTDEKWLSFAVEQLLSNAIKYTHEGEVTIRTQGDALLIEDTGIGIAPEDLPRIFEKGFTGYNGRAHKKSTGLGLYLCRRVLRMLAHPVSIESQAGRGTCVRIELSRADIVRE